MALVFVYGTLTDPETATSVQPTVEFRGEATLDGLHRVDGEYPTLAPGGETDGRLLETVHVDAIDRYEGVESGLYARISLPLGPGDGAVETYVGDHDRLGVDVDWPGESSFPGCVRAYVRDHDVYVRRDG